jgi:hypothetical protein
VCVCKSAIVLYLSVIKRECVTKVLLNPIIQTRTRHFRRVYHPTRDSISFIVNYLDFPSVEMSHLSSLLVKHFQADFFPFIWGGGGV